MSEFDVEPGEMDTNDFSSEQLDALVTGSVTDPELASTAAFLTGLREFGASVDAPVPTGAVTEFVGVDLVTVNGDLPAMAASNVHGPELQVAGLPMSHEPKGMKKMLSGITAFTATLTGKIVVGSTVALASVSGAHAADVIDVPLLPDTGTSTVEQVELDTNVDDALVDEFDGVVDEVDDSDVGDEVDEVDVDAELAELEAEYLEAVEEINEGSRRRAGRARG